MTGLRITYDEALMAIETLMLQYSLPKEATKDRLARAWVDALEGIEPGELRVAVKNWMKGDNSFFPRTGKIRAKALEYRRWVMAQRGESAPAARPDGPCQVCGAELRLLTPAEQGLPETRPDGSAYPKRFGVLHDELKHRRVNVPVVGYSTLRIWDGAA